MLRHILIAISNLYAHLLSLELLIFTDSSTDKYSNRYTSTLKYIKTYIFLIFLGAVAKLQKAIIRFVISVCPSVLQHGRTRLPLCALSKTFDLYVQKETN